MVPFVCSLLILWFLLRIAEQFELTEKAKRFVLLLFCFHPALVLLSGSVNNDCMSLMFTVMCVYYTILWSRFPTAHNILKLAVSIALGMLTKQPGMDIVEEALRSVAHVARCASSSHRQE